MSGNKSEGMLLCVRSYAEASEWSRRGLVLMPLEVLVMAGVKRLCRLNPTYERVTENGWHWALAS